MLFHFCYLYYCYSRDVVDMRVWVCGRARFAFTHTATYARTHTHTRPVQSTMLARNFSRCCWIKMKYISLYCSNNCCCKSISLAPLLLLYLLLCCFAYKMRGGMLFLLLFFQLSWLDCSEITCKDERRRRHTSRRISKRRRCQHVIKVSQVPLEEENAELQRWNLINCELPLGASLLAEIRALEIKTKY